MAVGRRAKVALGLVVAAGLIGVGVVPLARKTTIHISEPRKPARRNKRASGIGGILPNPFAKKKPTRRRR